jgi:HSP20 family protein
MTRKWSMQAIPASVITREMELNRDNLLSTFDKVFDGVFRDSYPEFHKTFGIEPFAKASYPKVNVISHDESVEIEAEIAGYSKDEVSVVIEDDVLSITGKASQLSEQNDNSVYLIRELKRSTFSRSFRLSDNLDATRIDATFKDGLLRLVIPRKQPVVPESKVTTVTIK